MFINDILRYIIVYRTYLSYSLQVNVRNMRSNIVIKCHLNALLTWIRTMRAHILKLKSFYIHIIYENIRENLLLDKYKRYS